ncbi:double-strand break repair helicase AddA [Stappia stellulata]|uniref:double-strand break repair helicase AddA n=1 Tax=Stappia stellulata TaxID=71235 RepID=UPI0004174DF8|nr:double-strand break repair helicase AddA [Stappia stellulata]
MSAIEIPAATRERQGLAADPLRSVWVSANAGSGKTFVLARRVIRLLLAGTAPSRILCLTFTKAAASEMQTRVFETLGNWTGYDDARLSEEVRDIEGSSPDAARLARARHLFATALETPGGLKIQTIHAFCEALLHQFPLEANVAGHFSVLDDRQSADLLATARAQVLARAERDPDSPLGRALVFLIAELPDKSVESALGELVARRDQLRRWLQHAGTPDLALKELQALFGLSQDETLEAIDAKLQAQRSIDDPSAMRIAEALESGNATDAKRAQKIRAALACGDPDTWRALWLSVFLNKDLSPTKALAGKAVATADPWVVERLQGEQQRLVDLTERRRAAYTLAGTDAALRLADAMLQAYEREKTRRGLMDFEDLIVRTASLLSRADAALWVQYKLDQGLDHILVDEAQDTSPHQWQVIKALAEEFFAGASANPRTRTLFAVGDEKQSIYSFQGAVPAYFAEMRQHFERRARDAETAFSRVELTLSFRSRPDVLSAVDTVFADPAVHRGLAQDPAPPVHEAVRRNEPGHVEIWPPEEVDPVETPDDWTQPVDRLSAGNAMIRLATRIAATIEAWRETGEADPEDVLVLVRKRGAFVDALTRALKQAGVPVAGSDRLVLNEHIAVEDLIALGRFLLLPEDDLSLAAVLKSPLFGLDEEALYRIARPDGTQLRRGTLWQSLVRCAETDAGLAAVRTRMEELRSRADFMPPFEFFSRLLSADGARAAFRARMGTEVDDVLDEFLALTLTFEQTGTPGLEGFLAWFAAAPTQVKRELNAARGVVRIMTVHGAKGLEAPLVILVDSGAAPVVSQHDPAFLARARGDDAAAPRALVWLPPKASRTVWHDEALANLRTAAEEEYRRLLYVAMTRARDRLVVCGWSPASGQKDGCWYRIVSAGLDPGARDGVTATGDPCRVWQAAGTQAPPPVLAAPAPQAAAGPGAPDIAPGWLHTSVAPLVRPRRLQPSAAFEEMETRDGPADLAPAQELAVARERQSFALARGRHLHRLLQLLPDLDADDRLAAAMRYLEASLAPEFAENADVLAREACAVLTEPGFAEVFSTRALTEVPVVGRLRLDDGNTVEVSGQIDRLCVTGTAVLIVDFKTDRFVPALSDGPGEAYVAQLAVYRALLQDIYPGRQVRASLLYTAGPVLREVPPADLDAAVAALKAQSGGSTHGSLA